MVGSTGLALAALFHEFRLTMGYSLATLHGPPTGRPHVHRHLQVSRWVRRLLKPRQHIYDAGGEVSRLCHN
jgi:hypothetical protein